MRWLLLVLLSTGVRAESLVSIDCDLVDVSVVLQSVADQIGMPLVLDPWVRGKVTVHLDGVVAEEAIYKALIQLELPTKVFITDNVSVEMSTDRIVCGAPPRYFEVRPDER